MATSDSENDNFRKGALFIFVVVFAGGGAGASWKANRSRNLMTTAVTSWRGNKGKRMVTMLNMDPPNSQIRHQ